MTHLAPGRCLRCAKPVKRDATTWLELNNTTSLYCTPGTVPDAESQGCFEFGSACARAVLKNGGELVCIGRAAD